MVRVMVVDDNPVIRSGVASVLEADGGIEVVGQAGNGKEALRLVRDAKPDVVLLDVRMPIMDGVAAAGPLSESARVLMLTYAEDEERVSGAIKAGASGYLVHGRFDPAELIAAVRAIAAGEKVLSPSVVTVLFDSIRNGSGDEPVRRRNGDPTELTEREAELMNLLAKGRTNGEIAADLFIAEKTVKNHINRIYAKLGVTTRAQAIARWLGVTRTTEGDRTDA